MTQVSLVWQLSLLCCVVWICLALLQSFLLRLSVRLLKP